MASWASQLEKSERENFSDDGSRSSPENGK
jgi:hypothetical protein